MERIETRDLESLAGLGAALWADPATYRSRVLETVSAVSLQKDLPENQLVDRAAVVLLQSATRVGMAANTQTNIRAIGRPFFRLFPEERFLLVALHRAKWSYGRLARLLDETPEKIEEMAWSARIHLAALARGTGAAALVSYPAGANGHKQSCPEWDARRPWAQRFLDDEIKLGSQRFFLQNHLMACDGCRATLVRCKDLYYALEALLPELESDAGATAQQLGSGKPDLIRGAAPFIQLLDHAYRSTRLAAKPITAADLGEITFRQSLGIFLRRSDVRWILTAIALFAIIQYSRT